MKKLILLFTILFASYSFALTTAEIESDVKAALANYLAYEDEIIDVEILALSLEGASDICDENFSGQAFYNSFFDGSFGETVYIEFYGCATKKGETYSIEIDEAEQV